MDFMLNPSFTSDDNAVPLDPARIYDVLIVGGGPAALTAAVYCMRKGVSTGLVTADFGGQVAETSAVENYMGYKYIEGSELVARFREQVKQFGIGVSEGPKAAALIDGPVKQVRLESKSVYQARTLILTTGKSWRRLNVPGEKELTGKGVAYCAICDAPFFAGKKVAVVGGGNSGIESAIDLAKIADKVIVVQFLDTLTADRVLIDALGTFPNIEILYEHEVAEIRGTSRVEAVVVRDRKSKEQREIEADGIFIEIGLVPNTGMVKDLLELNQAGEIVVDSACRTSRPGIFAAGDVTSVPFKQIIIAAGEGAKAALSACEYVLKHSS